MSVIDETSNAEQDYMHSQEDSNEKGSNMNTKYVDEAKNSTIFGDQDGEDYQMLR